MLNSPEFCHVMIVEKICALHRLEETSRYEPPYDHIIIQYDIAVADD